VGLHGYEQALRAFRNQIIQRQLRETKATLPWCRIGDMNGSYVFVHGKLLHSGRGRSRRDECAELANLFGCPRRDMQRSDEQVRIVHV
jgi:hypothetical protein